MEGAKEVRRRAGINAVLAAALCGVLPTSYKVSLILFVLTIVVITILSFSAVVLFVYDKFRGPVWKWLVTQLNRIEIEYLAVGLGLASTGIALIGREWLALGILLLLVGTALIDMFQR